MFPQNENTTDRVARLVVGVLALVLGLASTGPLQIVAFIVAFLGLLTGATGFCPLYKLLGFSTKK